MPVNDGPTQTASIQTSGTSATFSAVSGSSNTAVQQLNQPLAIPAIIVGHPQVSNNAVGFLDAPNIDGVASSFTEVAALPQIPGPEDQGFIVDLATAARAAAGSTATSTFAVWLVREDAARERSLVAILASHGVTITNRATASAHQLLYDRSSPAWAMRLAWIAAGLAALVAAMVLVITAAATSRGRLVDSAAMRQLGVGRRVAANAILFEQAAVVAVAVIIGVGTGVIGAQLALPTIPMFISPVTAPQILHPIQWTAIATTAAGTLLLLIATAVAITEVLLHRISADRLRQAE